VGATSGCQGRRPRREPCLLRPAASCSRAQRCPSTSGPRPAERRRAHTTQQAHAKDEARPHRREVRPETPLSVAARRPRASRDAECHTGPPRRRKNQVSWRPHVAARDSNPRLCFGLLVRGLLRVSAPRLACDRAKVSAVRSFCGRVGRVLRRVGNPDRRDDARRRCARDGRAARSWRSGHGVLRRLLP